ncbi:MAG TPA: GGDEF domain-containing protein [Gemmatimonadales bacterium]|nr:GGDEF domain-containing protein [Gemmatimonadales bacterium]
MRRRGAWVGPALRVLGLAAAALGVLQGGLWALVAAAGGFVVAFGLTIGSLVRLWQSQRPRARPLDFWHTVDLLRRAHGAAAGWAVGLREGDVEAVGDGALGPDALRRGAALVQLASGDGRMHVAREVSGTYVAVGDFPYGAGLLLRQRDAAPALTDAVAEDLRRLVATMRIAEMDVPEAQTAVVAKQLALIAAGAQTLDGVAKAGAEFAQQLSQQGAVVAIQDPGTLAVHVQAVSSAADKRLLGLTLATEAPVARAVNQRVPVVTQGNEDIFGPGVPERRRQERAGTAYPLLDGHVAVGALVLVGPPVAPDSPLAEQIGRLVVELGPRLAAARAVHEAEQRAVRDPLTGLCNRREFERVMDRFRLEHEPGREHAALIYVDLDRFKQLNDTLGHAAGDSALRHVATLLQGQLRDGDLVARIGGEEFAIWLPRTPLGEGIEVAERVRRAVEGTAWPWNGTTYRLTASCGVAAYPESVRDINNLRGAADAALYRAKQGGRNRVEMAAAGE